MTAIIAPNTQLFENIPDSDSSSDSDSDSEEENVMPQLNHVEEQPVIHYQEPDIDYDGLTQTISELCAEVMSELGPHYSEGIYHSCLQHELQQKGILSVREVTSGLTYKGIPIGDNQNFREDLFLPEYKCVLELKAGKISDKEEAQLKRYLFQNDSRIWGLCINFRTMADGRNQVEYVRMIKTSRKTVFNQKEYPILHRTPMVVLADLYPHNAVIFDLKEPEKNIEQPKEEPKAKVEKALNKAKCSCCLGMFSLTKNGTIRHHNKEGKKDNGPCEGVGKPPLDAN